VLSFFPRKEDHDHLRHARTTSPLSPIRAAASSNQEGKASREEHSFDLEGLKLDQLIIGDIS
jgi:hypothetical protein